MAAVVAFVGSDASRPEPGQKTVLDIQLMKPFPIAELSPRRPLPHPMLKPNVDDVGGGRGESLQKLN